jgi:predicted RNA binding protein YcfA (HicA-like mRNA interferase family)
VPPLSPIHCRKLVALFEKEGFTYARTKGDHLIYTKPGLKRPIVIPMWPSVPVFIIKNLLRTAGLSRERYFALLETV